MAEKRKYGSHLEISNISAVQSFSVERSEISKLTKVAKSWEFTCSFCFKAFPSAQAMGGHQNAHRSERLEEKRLFVRDPIGYRKRAYLQAVKAMKAECSGAGGGTNPSVNLHAASKVVIHEPSKVAGNLGAFNAAATNGSINLCHPSNNGESPMFAINGEIMNVFPLVVMNFLPTKEVSFSGNVAEDEKGKKGVEFKDGGNGMASEDLDLTLKL